MGHHYGARVRRIYIQAADGTLTKLTAADGLNTSNQNTSITFNYTPVYNSALDYTKGVQVNGLVIGILGNTTVNADITVPFSFALDPQKIKLGWIEYIKIITPALALYHSGAN
mgnify:CR=1 FL=1